MNKDNMALFLATVTFLIVLIVAGYSVQGGVQ